MSFHGGLLGVLIGDVALRPARQAAAVLRRHAISSRRGAALGLFSGRIGNFINGELWGKARAPTLPWAVHRRTAEARHPSQLYEALLEGAGAVRRPVVLHAQAAAARWRRRAVPDLYGVFRFVVEFVRVPDEQLGYLRSAG